MVVTKPGEGDEDDKEVMGGRRKESAFEEDDYFFEGKTEFDAASRCRGNCRICLACSD